VIAFTGLKRGVNPLWQMQNPPDWNGQRSSHALRVILLQPGDRFTDFDGKNAIDRAAIIAKTLQIAL
jgi:hypothetical protein